jgi:deoxycytidylate deaminase
MKEKWKDPFANPNFSSKDKRFLELARRVALKSNFKSKQVGVILVRSNTILVEGYNFLSHPKYLEFPGIDGLKYWSLHAEIAALAQIGDTRKATAYLFGYKKGRIGNAKPCPLCYKYLKLRNVRRVVFTTPFGGVDQMLLQEE